MRQCHKTIYCDTQHEVLLEELRSFLNLETETSAKFAQLDAGRLDSNVSEALRHLKDREHGSEFKQQFEDACAKLEEYVVALEREVTERARLTDNLRIAQAYYEAQFGDVKVVVTAYRRYGQMIEKMKHRLVAKMDALPEEFVPSVDVEDAPSPGNTPPQLRHGEREDLGAEVALLSRREEDMDVGDSCDGLVAQSFRRPQKRSQQHYGSGVEVKHPVDRSKRERSERNSTTEPTALHAKQQRRLAHQPAISAASAPFQQRLSNQQTLMARPQQPSFSSPTRSVDSAPSPPSDYEGDELSSLSTGGVSRSAVTAQKNISQQLRNLRDASSRNQQPISDGHNQKQEGSTIQVVGSGKCDEKSKSCFCHAVRLHMVVFGCMFLETDISCDR